MNRNITILTDVELITCILQKGLADKITKVAIEAGAQGATIHYAQGSGVREKLGILGVAVEAEKEVLQIIVSTEQVDRIFDAIYLAAELDTPGMGFMYVTRLEKAGMYFATINKDSSLRLSLEGTQLVGKQATEHILDLDSHQAENWLKGFDFNFETVEDGFYLLKYKEDFLGCGLIRQNKMFNFLPKTRRLKNFYD